MEATATERGPLMPSLLLLPRLSQKPMLTTVAMDTARGLLMLMLTMVAMDMEATDTARGLLTLMPTTAMEAMVAMEATDMARGLLMLTMVATAMVAMEATDTARGLLMPTMVATDMAAMEAMDTASKPQTSPGISPKNCF